MSGTTETTDHDLAVPGAGSLAITGATQSEARTDDRFTGSVREFLSDTELSVDEQLTTISDFWERLGLTPPVLVGSRLDRIQSRLESHLDRRVLAVPLLDFERRAEIAERAKTAFPHNQFGSFEALWKPHENGEFTGFTT